MAARVCLNMIVKNESRIIERCLGAAVAHIDCWVILDTGSTDETPQLIERFFAERDVPGRLRHGEFRNFEQARNDALQAALDADLDFDYLLLTDADMDLRVTEARWRERLTEPAYALNQGNTDVTYRNIRLVRRDQPARYRGVTHEYLDLDGLEAAALDSVWFYDHAQGSSRTVKYERDIALLTAALAEDPDNARYQYYLARSYLDSGQYDAALAAFRRRTELVGFLEEAFDSLVEIGRLLERTGAGFDDVHRAYLSAWENRPTRAEPLYELARYCRTQNRFAIGRMAAWQAMTIPRPADLLWVLEEVYTWRCRDEYAVACYWTGWYHECRRVCRELLDGGQLPSAERDRVRANLDHAQRALAERATAGPRH